MSAQAGVFYFDGRPVDPTLVGSIGRLLDEFGPDRSGQHIRPGLAMISRALHVTPEDRLEQQPYVSPLGHVITWDGRLDNRHDLLLQLWHDLDDDTTDVAIAMAVYGKWGAEGFAKLVGDWSLAIFDATTHAIVLASDYMAVRPLYYSVRSDSVLWSSTLECLVEICAAHDDLDPHFIVGFLSEAIPPGVTPYRNLRLMRAAHAVTIARSGKTASTRFWTFSANAIRYRNEMDYEVHLRDLFVGAVQNRLRSTHPVWAQLSGGLDSSAVVCAADTLVRESRVPAPDLFTVSYVTDGSPETDERRFAVCVDQQRGRASHYLQLDGSNTAAHPTRGWTSPMQPSGITLQTHDLIRRSAGRLMLTGIGGDTVMANCLDYHWDVAELLQRRRPLLATALARRRALAAQRPIVGVLRDACVELLPSLWIRRTLSQELTYAGGGAGATDAQIADLFALKPAYVPWWRDEWIRHLREVLTFPDVSQRRSIGESLRIADRYQAQSPSDVPVALTSHPFMDRPVVDFMLSIPIGIAAPPGQPRGLMRRACAPFVPARIIARFSKGYASPFIIRDSMDVLARWLSRPDDLQLATLECLDHERLKRFLESVRDGTSKRPYFLGRLVVLERWLESRRDHFVQRVSIPA